MKKRLCSILLAVVLVLTVLPAGALAAGSYGNLGIYIGYGDIDYMAEEILKEIPTAGRTDREKIRAVYDWIIRHCSREGWDGTYYFSEADLEASVPAFFEAARAAVDRGEIVIRPDLAMGLVELGYGSFFLPCDANDYVASFAYEMMMTRSGNCAHFAALLTVLLNHLGFDCRLIDGQFINRSGSRVEHKWNYVLLDGQYYWLDVRMDHAAFERSGTIPYDYFLVRDTAAWATEHEWDHDYSDALAGAAASTADHYTAAAHIQAGQPWSRCSAWAREAMEEAGGLELIPDRLAGEDLTRGITRAEFAAVAVALHRAMGGETSPAAGASPFTDTNDEAVAQAYTLGVVNGMGGGTFAPDRTLTREQAVTMLGRVCELADTGSVGDGAALEGGAPDFTDAAAISGYAAPYVGYFTARGIVAGMGDGRFAPKAVMTREQAVKVALETVKAGT
ncbi:MAG: hypothetical protein HFF17_08525 [Oscillospiraceae bacterium]|nr:hypothetical protein [Oscillospiraceae bacterium]